MVLLDRNGSSQYFSGLRSNIRQRLVNLIFLIYWLLIFEGVLRKWVLPELHQYLYFVRDPIVLLVYWYAIKGGVFPRNVLLGLTMALAFLMLFAMPMQMILQDAPIQVLLFGWRNYFFYVPLAFVIGNCFEKNDLDRLVKHTLVISIPMAMLVLLQFQSPPDSFINKGVSDDGFIMQVVENIVRTTGTFTYTAGQSFFCGSVIAMLAYVWILPSKSRPLTGWILWISSVSVAVMISLSGSRTVFFFVALVFLASITTGAMSKDGGIRKRALFVPLYMLVLGMLTFVFVFPESFVAMLVRQENAVSEEGSTLVRAFSAFYQFIPLADQAPFFGYGMGSNSAGGVALRTGGANIAIMDDEWSRMVMENGLIVALMYILIRVALAFELISAALRTLQFSGNPLGFILLGFLVMPLINGSITTQGTVNGYVWLFCGFCMAASKVYSHGIRVR